MPQKIILGYSGNVIAMLLESLCANDEKDPVIIIRNLPDDDDTQVPYLPAGIKTKVVMAEEEIILTGKEEVLLGAFTPSVKKIIFEYFEKKYIIKKEKYTCLFHPSSVVASSAGIENAVYIEPLSVISPFARLEFGVTINRNVSIGHHTLIGSFASIAPGVNIGGHSVIGEESQVGIGATVFNKIKIGRNTVIGGGSVVTADIPDNVIAWGNPCRVIKPNE